MWCVGDSPHPEVRISFVLGPWARDVSAGEESVNGQSSDCVSIRRIRIRPSITSGREPFGPVRGGEAILRDRYRLGHLSVVLLLSMHVGWLNVQL